MEYCVDIGGQLCSSRMTDKDDRSWRGVVEVRSIDALIKRDNEWW